MKRIFIIAICATLSACCPCRHIATTQHEIKDSVRVEVRTYTEYVRDTLYLEIPAISESVTVRDTTSYLENEFAESAARINSDGTLYHSLRTKPQKKCVPTDIPHYHTDSIAVADKVEYIEVAVPIERRLSWWQQTQMKGFWILLLLLVVAYRKSILALVRRFI